MSEELVQALETFIYSQPASSHEEFEMACNKTDNKLIIYKEGRWKISARENTCLSQTQKCT